MNLLRTGSIPEVDFTKPSKVLAGLDKVFKMHEQNGMYFTIWYGVYHHKTRELSYASSGHPPALMIQRDGVVTPLGTENMILGTDFGLPFESRLVQVPPDSRLYVTSDGVYEIRNTDNIEVMDRDRFSKLLTRQCQRPDFNIHQLLHTIQSLRNTSELEDDFSILEIQFV